MLSTRLFANPTSQTIELGRNRGELLIARVTECVDNLLIRCALNRSRSKNSGLTTSRLDFLFQPLKILVGLFVGGQDVHGVLDCDSAELLQLAPDANAQICRPGRQLMDEQYPFMS